MDCGDIDVALILHVRICRWKSAIPLRPKQSVLASCASYAGAGMWPQSQTSPPSLFGIRTSTLQSLPGLSLPEAGLCWLMHLHALLARASSLPTFALPLRSSNTTKKI